MSIGNAELRGIIYQFYEGRFLGVVLPFKGKNNYDLLEIICRERYGKEGLERGLYEPSWMREKSFIILRYNSAEETGWLNLGSIAIISVGLEQFETEKKKEAEKAEGDW